MLSSDDDEMPARMRPPPQIPPLPCLRLPSSSPSSHSNTVTFEGDAEQPFKAFVRTASGTFNSTLEWLGVQRAPRGTLMHEDFARSHFEPPRRRVSGHGWSHQDSPKTYSSRTYSSTNVSTLASPRYDDDGCWSRVDRRACTILLLVLLLGLTYAIGQQEHADALKRARAARAIVECLVIGEPSLPTQRPDPNSGLILYRLDVPVEFRDGSIGTAHEHSADDFCQTLTGSAAAKLAWLRSELDLRVGPC